MARVRSKNTGPELWNLKLDGFGNNDPGKGRLLGKRSAWDVIHPGRTWAEKLQPGQSPQAIRSEIAKYLAAIYAT